MNKASIDFICCPNCHNDLFLKVEKSAGDEVISGSLKCQKCNKEYEIEDGIADFVISDKISEKDKQWMIEYDKMARSYDILMCYLIPLFSFGLEPFERYRWVRQLGIKKGAHVLDVATGTGRNLSFLVKQVGVQGRVTAMDISKGMLTYAKYRVKRKKWRNIELHRANASKLPYKDNVFDAVIHVGGINTFGEKKKALYEIVRVAKPNAKIVIVDEGLAPGKENTIFGSLLLRTNALYWCKPPVKLLPKKIKNVKVKWGLSLFWPYYNIEFQKK